VRSRLSLLKGESSHLSPHDPWTHLTSLKRYHRLLQGSVQDEKPHLEGKKIMCECGTVGGFRGVFGVGHVPSA